MYFSKNSRCVLQRVRFLSPTFLKTNNQNLCMKKPKDDPTKPPLRINIPEDLPQNDGLPKLIKNSLAVNESRSKGLLKESKSASVNRSFDDNFLCKSESEIQFSHLDVDDALLKNNANKETISSQTLNPQVSKNQEDYNEGLQTVLNEEGTEAALAEIYLTGTATKPKSNAIKGKVSKKKNVEISLGNQTEGESSSKTLYIIIDVPQKSDEKYASEEIAPSIKDKILNLREEEDSPEAVRMPTSMGTNRQRAEGILLKKKYSFPKFDESKSKLGKKFEVHEIEDESTYIFHLKFNPNSCGKSCGVGWVPEKEVTTRYENLSYNDAPIKVKKSATSRLNELGKEMTTVDKPSKLFKYPENKKKQQNHENRSKTNLLVVDKKMTYEPSQSQTEAEAAHNTIVNDPDRSPKNFQPRNTGKVVSYAKEKRKNPKRFEWDDFGSVKAGFKNNLFKARDKTDETKQKESGFHESLSVAPTVNEQEIQAEAPSNPPEEVSEMSKVEKKEASVGHTNVSTFLQSKDKSFSPEIRKQYKNRVGHATDSYALYLGAHQKAPTKTEKSTDTYKKSETSEYLSIHEKEPLQSQSSLENIQNRNCIKCFSSNERAQTTKTENNQHNDEPQYLTVHEMTKTTTAQTSVESKKKKNEPQHTEIYTEISNIKTQNSVKNNQNRKKPSKKKLNENFNPEKLEAENLISSRFEKLNNDAIDFQTSASLVSIGCDHMSSSPATFGAAFPPFLREALNSRFKIRKDFLLNTKVTKSEIGSTDMNSNLSQKYKVTELSENSILFPKKESEKFDCDSLFSNKEEIILNIIKNEKDSSPKISDNVANVVNENLMEDQGKSSIDSLTMMKKVKEIVQFDFDNAVKIFKNGESESAKDLSSVVILKGNSWEVDTEELGKQMEMRKNAMKIHNWIDSDLKANAKLKNNILEDKTEIKIPKYLPSKEENPNEMKLSNDYLDSVIIYNPKTKKFFINKEALEDASSRRTSESFEEIAQSLNIPVKGSKNLLKAKSGDSILVFDEESQSWRVDFSILEKREQQLQIEKELTKRSELILETFEKLEKDGLSSIPKPDSKDKKTFDYKTEKWRAHDNEKKSTKSKSPFRECDAEEIRRKNSDLYENLFIAKKKETTMKKVEKIAPGLDSSKTNKESKSESSGENKKTSDSSSLKSSGSAPKNPESPKSDSVLPSVDQKKPTKKENDDFWEAFLKMNILPRDFREISNSVPSSKPLFPKKSPSNIAPKIEEPKPKTPERKIKEPILKTPEWKIEEPKPKTLERKIEEPKPITQERKIEDPKLKTPEKKIEDSKLKTPEKKIEDSKLKTPEKKIEDSKLKTPEKKIEDPKFKIQLPFIKDKIVDLSIKMIKPVHKEKSKTKDEKKAPPPAGAGPENKETPQKKAPPLTTSTPQKDPKSSTTSSTKEPPKPSPPSNTTSSGKVQAPKGKNEKIASPADHYVSDKIIEISKNKPKDNQSKIKTNKMETVKLNITANKRLPSKITEINLSKKSEEKTKESTEALPNSITVKKSMDGTPTESEKSSEDKKAFYKNLEKYKTPFSDPEYEENSMKIKSDIESNPNLKKLNNWNKTLVLHDIMKPPENIDSWLKDETDKMATLLLKILQEAANGKPKKKQSLTKTRSGDKNAGKGGNPYENIRKKQEVTPENFLFRVRTVNLSLEDDKKSKQGDGIKVTIKSEKLKDLPVQGKNGKPSEVIDGIKFVTLEKDGSSPTTSLNMKDPQLPENLDVIKPKLPETALEAVVDPALMTREFAQQNKLPLEITEEIPGPEILKKISNAWKAFPVLGSQMTIFILLRLYQLAKLGSSIFGTSSSDGNKRFAFTKLFTKYGPIVNIQGPLSGNVILIHKPEHLTAIFEQDATLLVRSVFDSLEKARQDSEEKTLSVNISTDWTKPEWNELKRGTDDPLFRGSEKYFRTVEVAGDSLVKSIRKNRNAQNLVSEDFMEEIRRWSLEGLCNVLFEKSFGFLEGKTNSMNWIMEPDKLYLALGQVTRYLNNCERGFQAWRVMATPSSAGLSQAYRTISSILLKQLYQAEINLKNKSDLLKDGLLFPKRELTFTESMMLNDGMTIEEITCNLVDVMLIGTNMMNSAMGFLLYNLAQNVKVQNKLLKELKEALPRKSSVLDYNKLKSLKYLQACLNESLRLHIPVPIFYKMLQNDVLLANYIVPKGTYVVMDYRVSCMKEQIFDDPDKYIPERWLNDEKWTDEIHPFTSFPLCHGPRAELAKRIVEMQLLTCVAKIIRNFQIEYHYGEIHETDSIMTFPDKPLKFNFIERHS